MDTRRMRRIGSPLAKAGMLLVMAGLCALISNSMAGPSRQLAWLSQPIAAPSIPPVLPVPAPVPPPSVKTEPTAVMKPADPSPPVKADRFAADPAQPIREISSNDAWGLFRAKVPFLDARRSAEYMEGHIADAWNVSVWESTVATQITEFEAAVKPGSTTPLVLYCNGGDCEDSQLLASQLTPLGYRNLFIYRAGYPDWAKHGRPTGQGARP